MTILKTVAATVAFLVFLGTGITVAQTSKKELLGEFFSRMVANPTEYVWRYELMGRDLSGPTERALDEFADLVCGPHYPASPEGTERPVTYVLCRVEFSTVKNWMAEARQRIVDAAALEEYLFEQKAELDVVQIKLNEGHRMLNHALHLLEQATESYLNK